ncbi:MAG: glycosyltransferase family 39 protein [Verrucomicrobia bacterium]|nr:glycosyltransferase family 39 protein [Verrucomicrobiota bacterium]
MTPRIRILLIFLVLLTGLRLLLASQTELTPDEAYYYLWAQHPGVGYFSAGPGVAVAVLAGTALLGPSELGVRLFSPLLGLGVSLIFFFFARHLYRERLAFWSVVALNLTPVFNLDSLLMTPGILALFFWTAALLCFWFAIQRSGIWLWALSGALIGCGFLSSYNNALQLLSVLIFLVLMAKYRIEFRRPGVYVLFGVFALSLLPPLIWNQQHDWIGLISLSSESFLKDRVRHFSGFVEFVTQLLILYSPLFFIALIATLVAFIPKTFRSSKISFLLSFSWPVLAAYALFGFGRGLAPGETAPAFVSLGLLACVWYLDVLPSGRSSRALAAIGLAVAAMFTLFILDPDLLQRVGLPISYANHPSAHRLGWKTAAEEIGRFRSDFEQKLGEPVFLIGNDYRTAAVLSFYLPHPRVEEPGHPPIYIPESQDIQNEFSFWPRYDEFVEPADKSEVNSLFSEQAGVNNFINRTALYISDAAEQTPPQNLQNSFTRWELVRHFQLSRRHQPLREFRIFACYQYQTLPL